MNLDQQKDLALFALNIRRETIKQIASLGVGHIGGAMSIVELLAVLYGREMRVDPQNPHWPERDRLVLSKGHAGPALYAALALKDFFPLAWLETLNRPGTRLPSHCDARKTPGIDMTTGSLGQGLSAALGMALGYKMDELDAVIYCIIGDGESNEGQIWEAALFGAHWKLNNVIAFLDYNKQMLDGFVKDICDIGDVRKKFEDFGWFAQEVDGHDVAQIADAIARAKKEPQRPSMIVLHTIKGKGLKKHEAALSNHNANVSKEDLLEFLTDFDIVEQQILRGGCAH